MKSNYIGMDGKEHSIETFDCRSVVVPTKKECIVCGGGHHYYNCPNDSVQEDGSINISKMDFQVILELLSDKIEIDNDVKYKLTHKKILDIVAMD